MQRPSRLRLWMSCLVLAVSGCAHCNKRCCIVGGCDPGLQAVNLPVTERGRITVDASLLGAPEALVTSLTTHDDARQEYCLLEPAQAQCLAARASRIARTLVNERRAVLSRAVSSRDGITPSVRLQADLLALASVHARNESAQNALELYYRTAQAEATLDTLRAQQADVQQLLDDLQRFEDQGLPRVAGRDEVQAQRVALSLAQPAALGARAQFHDQLAELLGVTDDSPCWFWPDTPLRVEAVAYEPSVEVAIAWMHRADLAMLQRIERSLRGDTVDGVRGALQSINPLLGSVAASVAHPCCCLAQLCGKNHGDDCEALARQQQAAAMVADQQAQIAGEVRRAIFGVEATMQSAAWAQVGLAEAEQRQAEVDQLHAAGRATIAEKAEARANVLAAQRQLVDSVIDWEIARVKLRGAQGLLADECGYTIHDPLGSSMGCVEVAALDDPSAEQVGALAAPSDEAAAGSATAPFEPELEGAAELTVLLPLEEHLP